MAHPAPNAPDHLADLTQGEHMLLWAFRAEAFGAGRCRLVSRQFELACPMVGSEALNALSVFVRQLGHHGRRRVTLGSPGSCRLSHDEQLILAVFATAQAEDYARMEAHLAWLLGAEPRPPFAAAACLVAQAFGLNGLVLRVPEMASAPPARALSDMEDPATVTPLAAGRAPRQVPG